MRILNKANLNKTVSYLKRNGIQATMLAVWERMQRLKKETYRYEKPGEDVLRMQRAREFENPVTFSVVVPVYHTPPVFYREMIESVLQQTYPHLQLILADAGKSAQLKEIAASYQDERMMYVELEQNKSIAENTNQALIYATGEYTALLDHDDLLTEDALYEMAIRILEGRKRGVDYGMLYSDEDKCDTDGKRFYEPNRKPDFDLDLLMTNNYICHLLVMKTDLIKELSFRPEFDGAQDHDLVLRAAGKLLYQDGKTPDMRYDRLPIAAIPKVLYHWRCHMDSTAANPSSKLYAYESGTRAIADLMQQMGWQGTAVMTEHMGFTRVDYEKPVWEIRPEVGAVGGKLLDRAGHIVGGRMDRDGKVCFYGLPAGFTGYLNRAVLSARAERLDLRCIRLNPAVYSVWQEILGIPYREGENGFADLSALPKNADIAIYAARLAEKLEEAGYLLLWDPNLKLTVEKS